MKIFKTAGMVLLAVIVVGFTQFPATVRAQDILKQFIPGKEEQSVQQSHDLLRDMIDRQVVDSQGRNIGQVKNIIIGERDGADYLIIAPGRELGPQDRLIPVPWGVAKPVFEEGQVRIDVSSRTLENAPGFRSTEWPNFASRRVEDRVHGYYGERSGSRDLNLNREKRDSRDLLR